MIKVKLKLLAAGMRYPIAEVGSRAEYLSLARERGSGGRVKL
jgi:hypothetical protein